MALPIAAAPIAKMFLDAVGLSIVGLAAKDMVDVANKYIEANPDESIKILSTLVPNIGIGQIFMSKEDKISLEDLDEMTDEEAQDLSKEDKAELMKQAGKSGGKDKRQTMIDISEKLGLSGEGKEKQDIEYDIDERYDEGGVEEVSKPKFDYKKFFRNRRADGGRVGFDLGGLTGPAKSIYDSMMAAGYFTEDEIRNAITTAGYEIPDAASTSIPTPDTGIIGAQLNQGGDNFSPYNPDPNKIRTIKQDPAIQANLEAIQRNQQLQSMGIQDPFASEMDPANAYYGDMPEDTSNLTGKQTMGAKIKEGLVGLMDNPITNLISSSTPFGMIKNIAKGIGNMLPPNERAIQENIMGNMGFAVNDIGQIVSTGDYNDPTNVMAGYNLYRMTPQTFVKRIDMINKNLKLGKYKNEDAMRKRLAAIEEAKRQFEAAEKLKRLAVEEARLKKGYAPSGGTFDDGPGGAYTGPGGLGGGQFTDSMGNVDYQDPYDPGGGEKDGGIIGYKKGGLASMFAEKR